MNMCMNYSHRYPQLSRLKELQVFQSYHKIKNKEIFCWQATKHRANSAIFFQRTYNIVLKLKQEKSLSN